MSPAKVGEKTALFPPQRARLQLGLPQVPGTLPPSFPVMACREKPLTGVVLSPGSPATCPVVNSGLAWYRRLPGRNRHHRLGPLSEENKTLAVNERAASGLSGSGKRNLTGTHSSTKSTSSSTTKSKTSLRNKSDDRVSSKKENGKTARHRPQDSGPSFDTPSRTQRMSYPPCTGQNHSTELAELPALKQSTSCPVLCDLDNLTITPKKTAQQGTTPHKSTRPSDKTMTRQGTSGHHKTKQDCMKRYGEHDRLNVPDANIGRQRRSHQRTRNSREEARTQRPKPPCWQDLPQEQTVSGASGQEAIATHTYAVPESVHSVPGYRCDSATTRSTAESERRAMRANIRRTRSRVIDSKEIPKHEAVLSLSQTKPSEFHLRKTYHDDTVYLLENAQRCRKWLADLKESDVTPLVDESESSRRLEEEIVTCDVEISNEKWNFLGSPYPSSSDCSSED
ncbi:uncharacterized protein LOC110977054 [Acanthaster planci]|uniref:Uncharacterized protein LOC110977054 n=1 Tax=Acanthaster planci TaxID=133434 RepID=A0A8B7Y2K5_ACAPL|nr:uncharacterized protein LOC110977054 [Acanthaster planci]XP_022086532.1 uncharacterized protein LOC110977054 [Acanthaster planci]XP_022086533.1 uncharacterized protein LOC110977054 [Acanthaster planci]XP_022086535.1 uncharacterized protein LOC110977054 [Acanthaster planci]